MTFLKMTVFSIIDFPIEKSLYNRILPGNVIISPGKIFYTCFCTAVYPSIVDFLPAGDTTAGKTLHEEICSLSTSNSTKMRVSV